jgi:hypothetical protein
MSSIPMLMRAVSESAETNTFRRMVLLLLV